MTSFYLITSARTLFPNKFTFWGPGGSIHNKCNGWTRVEVVHTMKEDMNEASSLCPLKCTPSFPFLPNPTSYFLHSFSGNFLLIAAVWLYFPIQPSYFCHLILSQCSLHELIYLTEGPPRLTFSSYIKSETTLPPSKNYSNLNLSYLL